MADPIIDPYAVADGGYVQVNPEPHEATHHHVTVEPYNYNAHMDEMCSTILKHNYNQLTVHLVVDLTLNDISPPNPTAAEIYNFCVTNSLNKVNIPGQKLIEDCTEVDPNLIRILGIHCMLTGASAGTFNVLCPNAETCAKVYRNIVPRLFTTPLRAFRWEVRPRKMSHLLGLPATISKIPPAYYEGVLHKTTPASS